MKKLRIYLDTSVINFLFADESLGYYYPLRIVTPLEVMGREETK